jgi:asparagine synthase (glutamine-hydrolysing)
MSRIAGLYMRQDGAPVAPALVTLATAAASRGSWHRHSRLEGPAGLAWTGWLAPVIADTGGAIAVVDGVFYNRAELSGAGNDAAVLIALYRRYGFTGALERINGDFAVALFDAGSGTLWLARDRFGVKPLYYSDEAARFAFASRPRALLALPDTPRGVDRRFVALFAGSHYRYFDNAPEHSAYAAIRQLPAGHLAEVTEHGTRTAAWWRLDPAPDLQGDEAALAERYRDLLLDAVRRRVAAATRPAFTLSGGLDSSSILASTVEITGRKQHAYSVLYVDKTYDERDEIQSMLAEKVESWHPVTLDDAVDVFDLVEQMIELHDEPVATATWLSHFLLCQEVQRGGFDALFGGLGGDELNAGEYEYFVYHFADLRHEGRMAALEREVDSWARHHDHPIYRKGRAEAEEAMARLVDPAKPGVIRADGTRARRYAAAVRRDWYDLTGFQPQMPHPFASCLKNRSYADLLYETAPCCLRAEDRHCTAFELQRFDPFFDHRLVDFMFRIPGDMKIRDGVTKILLRRAMTGILPEETRTRIKKTGWNAPTHRWFTGRGLERLRDLVASRRFRERGVYDPPAVERIIDEHAAIVASAEPRENHMMFLWQLVNLETWLARVS